MACVCYHTYRGSPQQIHLTDPQCIKQICTCAHFCYKRVHCGIWDWCIAGLVQQVYWVLYLPPWPSGVTIVFTGFETSLRWRHNELDGVSNHQPYDSLPNRLFRHRWKKTIKARRHWPLWGEFTGDRWIPRAKGQWRGECFHLMTSSWYR